MSRQHKYNGLTAIIIGAAMLALPAMGATITWDGEGADNEWTTGDNWDPDGTPGSSDKVTIDNGDTVILSGDYSTGKGASLEVSNNSTFRRISGYALKFELYDQGDFIIASGGRVELDGSFSNDDTEGTSGYAPQMNLIVGDESEGTFVFSSGTFGGSHPHGGGDGNDNGIRHVYVGNGADSDGTFRSEGGDFYANWDDAQFVVGRNSGTGRVEVSGTGGSFQVGLQMYLNEGSTLAYEIGGNGVRPIDVGAQPEHNDGGEILDLAGSLEVSLLEEPTSSDIKLINFMNTSDPVTGTFSGLSEGDTVYADFDNLTYLWDITYQGGDGNDVVLTNMATIPEPTSLALLALGLAGLLGRRPRRRK